MVSETNKIILIRKRHDPFRILLWRGEQRRQDPLDPSPEFCGKVIKDQVWVLFGDRRGGLGRDVVPEGDVV